MNNVKKMAKEILSKDRNYTNINIRELEKVDAEKLAKELPVNTEFTVSVKTTDIHPSYSEIVVLENKNVKILKSQYLSIGKECSLKTLIKLMIETV